MTETDKIDAEDVQFSDYAIKQIGQKAGVERMSDMAARRVSFEQEREIQSLLSAAQVVANAAGRKTVREEDILRVKEIVQEVSDA
jgi:histone H3/H4